MSREQLNKVELLDTLTATVTAFANWNEFKAAMVGGYVPTIRPVKLARRSSLNQFNYAKAVDALATMVRAEGFKVFDGQKTR
jgi:hypothetical protein